MSVAAGSRGGGGGGGDGWKSVEIESTDAVSVTTRTRPDQISGNIHLPAPSQSTSLALYSPH